MMEMPTEPTFPTAPKKPDRPTAERIRHRFVPSQRWRSEAFLAIEPGKGPKGWPSHDLEKCSFLQKKAEFSMKF